MRIYVANKILCTEVFGPQFRGVKSGSRSESMNNVAAEPTNANIALTFLLCSGHKHDFFSMPYSARRMYVYYTAIKLRTFAVRQATDTHNYTLDIWP